MEETGYYLDTGDPKPYKRIRARFLGPNDPLALLHGKVYEVIVGQKGMYCIIDETGEEYGYPPHLFEIVKESP